VRIAVSESLVADVNINDARAAMTTWLKQMMKDLKYEIEYSPRVFDPPEEIFSRARSGRLDAVALNILEYRQIADCLDPGEIVAEASSVGWDWYVLLAKQENEPAQLSHLRGKRLCILKAPKMCVAPAWIGNLLDAAHLGTPERYFGSIATETKISRVILSVFFGQTDACITTKASFDTMCEMNPQVGRTLRIVAMSAPMVVTFYVFHKSFHSEARQDFTRILSELRKSAAGRQLATLFQFEQLSVLDARCLESGLNELDLADRSRAKRGVRGSE
jgi:phosphonate transport system substrate-binding protein